MEVNLYVKTTQTGRPNPDLDCVKAACMFCSDYDTAHILLTWLLKNRLQNTRRMSKLTRLVPLHNFMLSLFWNVLQWTLELFPQPKMHAYYKHIINICNDVNTLTHVLKCSTFFKRNVELCVL